MAMWIKSLMQHWHKQSSNQMGPYDEKQPISFNLSYNENTIRSTYRDSSDVVIKSFFVGSTPRRNALLIYISETVNLAQIEQHVLHPLQTSIGASELNNIRAVCHLMNVPSVQHVHDFPQLYHEVANGHPVLLIDHLASGLALNLAKWSVRQIQDATTETVIRGPKESFVESADINMSLIRRRLRTPRLKMKKKIVGSYTQTQIIISYIDGICDPRLIKEVEKRIDAVTTDGVYDSGTIQERIKDSPYSIFPTIYSTERPDSVCASLIEGRASVIIDGSPYALILPTTFSMFFSSPEDYYSGFIIGSSIRILRLFNLMIALMAPSLYVAVTTYHQEMIPTTLLLAIAQTHEQVPFPSIVEALLMELTFEGLREAGVRLPSQVGPALSIVGALVIGQAAIQASIVSPAMVIVVSITAIASFMIPNYAASNTIRILRFPMILMAGMFGLLGVIITFLIIMIHQCSLRSFGVPYMEPIAPFKKAGMIDTFIRAPLWLMKIRPHFTGSTWNKRRNR
ncbi:MAG: spore germination protein [Sporolactobacillus sp.]